MGTVKAQATIIEEPLVPAGPLVPAVALENAFRYWWIIAAMIVIGGLGGLLAHYFNPPLYEATAEFSVAIDYVSTGPMTQYAEDLAVNTAGSIFVSGEVLEILVNQAEQEGIHLDPLRLGNKIYLERKFSAWTLRVRDTDPAKAERIAAIWAEQGEAILKQSYQHALQAQQLERYLLAQESYLAKLGAQERFYEPGSSALFADIQRNLQEGGAALYQEKLASRGLSAAITLGPFNPPQVSQQPVIRGRNLFVGLGSLLGFLLGIVLVELAAPKLNRMKS